MMLIVFIGVALLLAYALCAIQVFTAYGLTVKVDSMVKNIGDTVTVTVTPVPTEAVVTNVQLKVDPAFLEATEVEGVYKVIAAGITTVEATAAAIDGSPVSGNSEFIQILEKPPVIATGLLVAVA